MRSTDLHFANLRIFRELFISCITHKLDERAGIYGLLWQPEQKKSSLGLNEAETEPDYFGLYRDIAKFAL